MTEVRIIPMRITGSLMHECKVDFADMWSVEVQLDDGSWDSQHIIRFYDEEDKWSSLETAREYAKELMQEVQ
jgi:hypothetical protein